MQSKDPLRFYGSLFDAAPLFLAPRWLYDSLIENTDNTANEIRQDAQQLKSLKKARNVCEEKLVDIGGSLKNAIHNLDGSQLKRRISEVQKARAEGGDVAAEPKVTELIICIYIIQTVSERFCCKNECFLRKRSFFY